MCASTCPCSRPSIANIGWSQGSRLPREWLGDGQEEYFDGECILVGEYMAVCLSQIITLHKKQHTKADNHLKKSAQHCELAP